jgi:hypothetical protein
MRSVTSGAKRTLPTENAGGSGTNGTGWGIGGSRGAGRDTSMKDWRGR